MMRRFLLTLVCLTMLSAAAFAGAGHDHGNPFLQRLDAAVADGELTAEQSLLYRLQYVFDADALPEAWRPVDVAPLKCVTEMIHEYTELRPSLGVETVKTIDAYLAPDDSPDKATYLSPLGHFNLTYLTTGGNAVPATDTDPANGIPDYVERCAEYLDTSWETEIVSMGFTAPPTHPYPISFESMSAYGYTTVTGGTASRIVLHNTFQGFPPNDDPDGDVLGAAKVTAAHEFKHASQLPQSGWSEGGWVELDATWMEDVVFDQVNDYYNYMPSGSGISSPGTSLDGGSTGTGSYDDAIWQHWMSETWGEQIVIDFWDWRSTHTTQGVLLSYDSILGQNGSSLADGFPMYAAWNFATGTRSLTGIGYEEASQYPSSSVTVVNSYPRVLSGSTEHLAAANYYCYGFGGLTGTLDVTFNGQDGTDMALMAVIRRTNGTGVLEQIPLDAANDCDASLSVPLEEMAWAGVIVVNSKYYGTAATWDLTIDAVEVVAQPMAQLSTTVVNASVEVDANDNIPVTLSNVGDVGSSLDYTASIMDIDPTVVLARRPAPTPRTAPAERAMPELIRTDLPAPVVDRYAGDCVFGNDDTANIQGYYGSWWYGNETYAVAIDPPAEACSCAAGFNVRAVHMVLYLEAASTPQVRALLATDAGACTGPGTIIDTSDPLTVAAQGAAGYYDIEIPCDFVCTDMDGGPYFVLFEFMDASGPVGIPVDSSPTSCYDFNDWGSGWEELVGGYSFAGDLLLWADVDCCGAAAPEVGVIAPNGGEFLAKGTSADLEWTATVVTDVMVELSRDGGGSWETLFASTPNDGIESWTVAGASSTDCLLRVSTLDGLYSDVSDAPFAIHDTLPWLFAVPETGSVPEGSSVDVYVGVSGAGMAAGNYTGYVVLASNDPAGPAVITVNLEVTDPGTGVGDAPAVFMVEGNHPNPFNPSTRVVFSLAQAGPATVDVLDLQGRVVRTLLQGDMPAGRSSLTWDGRDELGRGLASGTYIARLRSGGMVATHKLTLTK